MNAKSMLIRAALWVVVSSIFLDVSWSKVADLRSAGMYVNPLRYGQIVLWALVAAFWLWNGWRSLQQSSKKRNEQEKVV